MKKYAIFALMAISSFCFAEDCQRTLCGKEMFTYVALGGGGICIGQDGGSAPAVAFGRRYATPYSAIDLSFHFSPGEKGSYIYSAPRLMYLQYLQPEDFCSLYVGGGLSWTGISGKKPEKKEFEINQEIEEKRKKRQKFTGIAAEFAVGYEFCRDVYIRPFVEISITQCLFSTSRSGSFPAPCVMGYLGAGF